MTAEQFEIFWSLTYPQTVPISHYFKHDYKDRWFRIHSLPDSERYANTPEKWEILLSRQNEIISDLLDNSQQLYLVTGYYEYEGYTETSQDPDSPLLADFNFINLNRIDLHSLSPDSYDQGQYHKPCFAKIKWENRKYDPILRSIANDEIRVFFVSIDKKCIVAPYDGGVDFVLESPSVKSLFKEKYKAWLSPHPEGL